VTTESLRLPGSPFDKLAEDYDASFTQTMLGRWLRSAVWERLDANFADRGRILDIGCGTGEDAIHLASQGHSVVATDISMPMLEIAREKAKRAGCARQVNFFCLTMEQLGVELAGETFDGVCSNFGAVNCVSDLEPFVENIANLLKPGAPLVWVVMGRHVPWEWAWFLARLEGRKAFRRLHHQGTEWRGLRINYPTPAALARALGPHFDPVRRRSLGLVLPPSYASNWLERWPRLFSMLARVERMASAWQPLAAAADHYIMEARCRPTEKLA